MSPRVSDDRSLHSGNRAASKKARPGKTAYRLEPPNLEASSVVISNVFGIDPPRDPMAAKILAEEVAAGRRAVMARFQELSKKWPRSAIDARGSLGSLVKIGQNRWKSIKTDQKRSSVCAAAFGLAKKRYPSAPRPVRKDAHRLRSLISLA